MYNCPHINKKLPSQELVCECVQLVLCVTVCAVVTCVRCECVSMWLPVLPTLTCSSWTRWPVSQSDGCSGQDRLISNQESIQLRIRGSRLESIQLRIRGSRLESKQLRIRRSRLESKQLRIRGSHLESIQLRIRGSRLESIQLRIRRSHFESIHQFLSIIRMSTHYSIIRMSTHYSIHTGLTFYGRCRGREV